MIKDKLTGLGVAVVTPFYENGEVNHEHLASLVKDIVSNGVDYVVGLGTTSESPTLSETEKVEIMQTIVEAVSGQVPVLMGLGGPSTDAIISKLKKFHFRGIDAFLSVTPYYNRPSQKGLYQHYKEISYYSPLPIVIYNIQSRTACNLEVETTLSLAEECKNIIAIKEASGNMNQIMRIINHKPDSFAVISGDDAITLPLIAAGADGVISVIANALPKEMADLVHLCLENNFPDALKLHLRMLDLIQACFREGNPAGIKTLLSIQKKIDNFLRLPLTPASEELQACIEKLYFNFKNI
ncbi:MAG TPA: 4-hydroxy-tetrahydrodipicolinate synthase [Bacteroidales bacterium]|jgi:4-hydroxy-tetrahydrodipicolinate synthase|nr:4-hydroxy-tetrahydrodipicolinate synthase [Bacteroidales bacterium]HPY80977.1 4-hydroxy-tetrahydrodipicolinate synthase [Bacteroidales bacterium]HQA86427.1 4-hydroxy-tetrahydrodipicolinate synthase [Bacteroidales bacterium]